MQEELKEMREEFESWFSDEGKTPASIERNGDGGGYRLAQAQAAWWAWQAAWNRRTPVGGGVAEAACGCATCVPNSPYMILCATCGNKRCPHAKDHRNACTNSNEPGQPGSSYEHCAVFNPDPVPAQGIDHAATSAVFAAIHRNRERFSVEKVAAAMGAVPQIDHAKLAEGAAHDAFEAWLRDPPDGEWSTRAIWNAGWQARGQQAGVPEGCVIVPKEPTEAMIHAAEDIPAPRPFGQVYRAMIAAAAPGEAV